MSRRGIVLEIAGHSTAYASHSNAPTTWATSVRSAILGIPQGSALSVDYDTLRADSGGTDVGIRDASPELLFASTGTTTTLDGAHTAAVTTITVSSTSGFTSSGTVWIGQEAIAYTGTTATTFTGCTRAQLGTTASTHADLSTVYSYSPTMLGRKCILKWYDQDDTTNQTTRYTGFIDAVDFSADGYRLTVISAKSEFEGAKGLQPQQGKGRLELDLSVINRLEISYSGDEQGKFLTLPATSTNWPYYYMRIDDELIRYEAKHVTTPAFVTTVASVASGYEFDVTNGRGYRPGRTIEFLNGSGDVAARGTITERPGGATVKHNAGYTPTGGDTVRIAGWAIIEGAKRGVFETRIEPHKTNTDVAEYRVLRGNHCDILLWIMLSKAGDKSNTNYDVLPDGWGCGIDSALVDINAFEQLVKPRASRRLYTLQSEVDLLELIGQVATATNCRIYWGSDGILTCNEIHDLFPLDSAGGTITTSEIVRGSVPQLRIDLTQIRNVWEWDSDHDLDGDKRAVMRVELAESRRLYGDRPMPRMVDFGMRSGEHNGISYPLIKAALDQRSAPVVIITAEVLFDDANSYHPGQTVALTIDHLPNMTGGTGYSGEIFEVLSWAPSEGQATGTITLARRPSLDALGHVAPVCVVESVSVLDVTVRPRSYSKYAPLSANFTPPGGAGEDGTEDVHWFLGSDAVRFVDSSTLGNATPTSASAAITAIDYATRVITVDAVPIWLAAGDLLQLDDWATVTLGGNSIYREGIFLALADESALTINGDDPYVWGL